MVSYAIVLTYVSTLSSFGQLDTNLFDIITPDVNQLIQVLDCAAFCFAVVIEQLLANWHIVAN